MNDIVQIIEREGVPKNIVRFMDGRMTAKNTTKTYRIVKKLFKALVVIVILASILFKEFLLSGASLSTWCCFIIVIGYLKKNGGYERKENPSELRFFDDHMIFYVPKYTLEGRKTQMEIQKIYFKDVTKCQFRRNSQKVVIGGMLNEIHYPYDEEGRLVFEPDYQKKYDGMIKFYTTFDREHDFKKIIEENTPLTVEIQDV